MKIDQIMLNLSNQNPSIHFMEAPLFGTFKMEINNKTKSVSIQEIQLENVKSSSKAKSQQLKIPTQIKNQ